MPARPRWFAAAFITVASIVLAHYAQVWTVVPSSLAPTSDFAGTYVAATLVRTGHAAQMYDPTTRAANPGRRVARLRGTTTSPSRTRPGAAVVALPFSLLSAGAAWRAWSILQLLLIAVSLWLVARAAPWPASMSRLPQGGDRAHRARGVRDRAGPPRGAVGRRLRRGTGDRLRRVASRQTGRGGLRARVHGGDRQAAARDRHRRVHARPARLARNRRRAGGRGGHGAHRACLPTVRTAWWRSSRRSRRRTTHRRRRCRAAAGSSGRCSARRRACISSRSARAWSQRVVAGWLGAITRHRADLFEPSLCAAVALSLFASPHLLGHDLTLLAPVLIGGLAWLAGRPTEAAWPGPATLVVIAGGRSSRWRR